jgi:hypothetical protein
MAAKWVQGRSPATHFKPSTSPRSGRYLPLSLSSAILAMVSTVNPLVPVATRDPLESESERTVPPSSMTLRAAYCRRNQSQFRFPTASSEGRRRTWATFPAPEMATSLPLKSSPRASAIMCST